MLTFLCTNSTDYPEVNNKFVSEKKKKMKLTLYIAIIHFQWKLRRMNFKEIKIFASDFLIQYRYGKETTLKLNLDTSI